MYKAALVHSGLQCQKVMNTELVTPFSKYSFRYPKVESMVAASKMFLKETLS